MFKCDQLIYIEMQKTGSTSIKSLLSNLFHGEQIGMHNAATQDQITSNKYIISSIRNPWDWYLSLWSFGVLGDGDLMKRLTKRNDSRLSHELSENVTLWRDLYDRGDNVDSFRKWLKLIHNPGNSHFMGEGYANTAIVSFCGFMTYRYLYLCCQNISELINPGLISSYTDLVQFEKNNCYISFFIRQESLKDNLCKAVEKVRPITREEKELIYGAEKALVSKRRFLISDYYDKESIELVRSRDRLLVTKFDYSPPQIAEQGAAQYGESATLHPRQ
jgi:hypothetical protein